MNDHITKFLKTMAIENHGGFKILSRTTIILMFALTLLMAASSIYENDYPAMWHFAVNALLFALIYFNEMMIARRYKYINDLAQTLLDIRQKYEAQVECLEKLNKSKGKNNG